MRDLRCSRGIAVLKLILSRKGVDSSAGGFASPVFPDGSLLSVAIPDKRAPLTYGNIKSSIDIGKLVNNLSGGKVTRKTGVHLDPDIDRRQLDRRPGWNPAFGQCGAAQTHLLAQGVGTGDIFLFFGWFRRVEYVKRRWRYVPGAPDQHVIFGWLQIRAVHDIATLSEKRVLDCHRSHPHFHGEFSGHNALYEGSTQLTITGSKAPGAGTFRDYQPHRCLTAAGHSRSRWALPQWMHPDGRQSVLSYHGDHSRWHREGKQVMLRSAARGQEFVLDVDHYPEATQWLTRIFADVR